MRGIRFGRGKKKVKSLVFSLENTTNNESSVINMQKSIIKIYANNNYKRESKGRFHLYYQEKDKITRHKFIKKYVKALGGKLRNSP